MRSASDAAKTPRRSFLQAATAGAIIGSSSLPISARAAAPSDPQANAAGSFANFARGEVNRTQGVLAEGTFIESQRPVPVAGHTDVLVCGGGPAGIAAALAAARAGAQTRLIE